jgi:hypothetical protein
MNIQEFPDFELFAHTGRRGVHAPGDDFSTS